MPYRKTLFVEKCYYHVFTRGNEKRVIFTCERDYYHFMDKFKEALDRYAVDVICYCLMSNHFHLVLKEKGQRGISRLMHDLSLSYAKYFNIKYGRTGYLYENRFKAKFIDTNSYLVLLSKYIHLNPAVMVKSIGELENYPWSSYAEYIHSSQGICQ